MKMTQVQQQLEMPICSVSTRKGCLVGRPLGMGGRVAGRQSDKELDAGKSSPGHGLKVVVWAIFLGKAILSISIVPTRN